MEVAAGRGTRLLLGPVQDRLQLREGRHRQTQVLPRVRGVARRDGHYLTKLDFEFRSLNQLELKDDVFPFLTEIEKRADVLAKLALYNIYSEEHKKLKQAWKNDENYQEMLKNEKKMKSDMEPEKTKEGDQDNEDHILRLQVSKVLFNFQEKANLIAHDQFRQLNGEKAVQTKKSLEKLVALV